MTLWFGDAHGRVGVSVPDPEVAAVVGSFLGPLRVAPTGEERPGFALERAGAAWRFHGAGAPPRRFRSLPRALSALEHGLAGSVAALWKGIPHLHAAGVLAPAGAILAVGPSGAGKSSLAFAASLAGHPVLTDDCAFVERDGRVRGLPRLVKVHRRQLHLHEVPVEATVAPHPRVAEVWWDPASGGGGGWAEGWHPAALVAFVHRGRGRPRIVRVPRTDGLRLLLDALLAAGAQAEAALDPLLEVARGAEFVDLRFETAGEGMEALLAATRAGGH